MKRVLITILFCLDIAISYAQYNPNNGYSFNNPMAPAGPFPTDMRTYYFTSNRKLRQFKSTSELLAYFPISQTRIGNTPYWINTGTLQPDSVTYIGGQAFEYMFRNGVADSNLVLINIDPILFDNGITNNSGIAELGGNLNQSTTIGVGGNTLILGGTSSSPAMYLNGNNAGLGYFNGVSQYSGYVLGTEGNTQWTHSWQSNGTNVLEYLPNELMATDTLANLMMSIEPDQVILSALANSDTTMFLQGQPDGSIVYRKINGVSGDNGLSLVGSNIELGGNLNHNTQISGGANSLVFNSVGQGVDNFPTFLSDFGARFQTGSAGNFAQANFYQYEDAGNRTAVVGGEPDGHMNIAVGDGFMDSDPNKTNRYITFASGYGEANQLVWTRSGNLSLPNTGKISIGIFPSLDYIPTASLQIRAGSTTAGSAPIKLTSGTLMATPENGAIEYDGTNYWGTIGSTRKQLNNLDTGTATQQVVTGWDLEQTSSTIIFDTVSTIQQLEAYNKRSPVNAIVVTDSLRGGLFYYQSTAALLDSGTVFPAWGKGAGYWIRRYTESLGLNTLWFGARNDSIEANTTRLAIQEAINKSSAGNMVFFPAGIYQIDSSLVLHTGVKLIGAGKGSTKIILASNVNKSIVTLLSQNEIEIAIESLTFDGNRGNQTSYATGINLSNTLTEDVYDYISDIFIQNIHGNGMLISGAGGGYFDHISMEHLDSAGLVVASQDQVIGNISIGHAATSAFDIHGDNLHVTDCKGWGSDTGFRCNCLRSQFINDEAQDARISGFMIEGNTSAYTNILIDAVGWDFVGDSVIPNATSISLTSSSFNNTIIANTLDRAEFSITGSQSYAINCLGSYNNVSAVVANVLKFGISDSNSIPSTNRINIVGTNQSGSNISYTGPSLITDFTANGWDLSSPTTNPSIVPYINRSRVLGGEIRWVTSGNNYGFASTVAPITDSVPDLGQSFARWRDLWLARTAHIGNTQINTSSLLTTLGPLYLRGGATVAGVEVESDSNALRPDGTNNWDLGSITHEWRKGRFTDSVFVKSLQTSGPVDPTTDSTYSLGSSSLTWNNIYTKLPASSSPANYALTIENYGTHRLETFPLSSLPAPNLQSVLTTGNTSSLSATFGGVTATGDLNANGQIIARNMASTSTSADSSVVMENGQLKILAGSARAGYSLASVLATGNTATNTIALTQTTGDIVKINGTATGTSDYVAFTAVNDVPTKATLGIASSTWSNQATIPASYGFVQGFSGLSLTANANDILFGNQTTIWGRFSGTNGSFHAGLINSYFPSTPQYKYAFFPASSPDYTYSFGYVHQGSGALATAWNADTLGNLITGGDLTVNGNIVGNRTPTVTLGNIGGSVSITGHDQDFTVTWTTSSGGTAGNGTICQVTPAVAYAVANPSATEGFGTQQSATLAPLLYFSTSSGSVYLNVAPISGVTTTTIYIINVHIGE